MRTRSLLLVLVSAAAALRFSTLGVQSFWGDEGFTVTIVNHALTGVLAAVRHTESTPPLYYWIARVWRELFGSGEWGLRSLSALFGTLTVPATYAAARELFSRRAGLISAAFVTFSPVLIWYSQEARAYSLLLLLGTISVWLFARALHGDRRALWGWAVTAALALATHYFAVFTVLPEAVWLIARRPRQWRSWAAVAPAGAVALALLPLFLYQDRQVPRPWTVGYTITDSITGVAQAALVGPTWTPIIHRAGVGVMAILALAGLILLARDRSARGGALVTLLLAGALVAAPLAYAVLATNYLDIRNVIVAVPLALMAVAAGFSATTPPVANALVAAVCAVGLAIAIAVPLTPALQREDWRGAIARLSSPALPRVWVFLDRFDSTPVSTVYLTHAANLGATPTPAREVDILGRVGYPGTSTRSPIPGFSLIERRVLAGKLAIERFRAGHAIPVTDAEFDQFNARVVTTAAGYDG